MWLLSVMCVAGVLQPSVYSTRGEVKYTEKIKISSGLPWMLQYSTAVQSHTAIDQDLIQF